MVDLTDLTDLPTACPVVIHHTDDHGQVVSLAIRVTGSFAARRLRALFEVTHLHTFRPERHPAYDTYHTPEETWILTANGNAGRVSHAPGTLILDDGFHRELARFPVSPTPRGHREGLTPALERAARFLHAERAQEPCRRRLCGCSLSWPCASGCTPVKPGLCSACAPCSRPPSVPGTSGS